MFGRKFPQYDACGGPSITRTEAALLLPTIAALKF